VNAPRPARKHTLPSIPQSLQPIDPEDADHLEPGFHVRQTKEFEITECIGEGGMGKIYRAYDPIMDRYLAVKVLKLDVPQAAHRRFAREAVIAANFSHPNLPRVLDRGVDHERELEWMTMEYLRGRDLGVIIDLGRKIALSLVIDIFIQTLDALDYIHTRKIIHCDVKPDNIFVTRDSYDRGIVIVKLIDFGVCRSLDDPPELQNQLVGDPRYMAPEQTVLNEPVDHRTDLYALGITLYEALTGEHPFGDVDQLSAHELLRMQTEVAIPRLAQRATHLPGHIAEAFDDVLFTACAKDKRLRFPHARVMKEALEAIRRGA
jgi:serine/threonine protein kinase